MFGRIDGVPAGGNMFGNGLDALVTPTGFAGDTCGAAYCMCD